MKRWRKPLRYKPRIAGIVYLGIQYDEALGQVFAAKVDIKRRKGAPPSTVRVAVGVDRIRRADNPMAEYTRSAIDAASEKIGRRIQ